MLSRKKICFHPVECCCSHFPLEVWIFGPICQSHTSWESALAPLMCCWIFKALWVIHISLLLSLSQPVAWTAQLSCRRGKMLPPSSCAALQDDALCASPPASSTGCGWAEICLDPKFPLGGERMNTCKNHRKVQRELNNRDTGVHFTATSNGIGLREEKYRQSAREEKDSEVKLQCCPTSWPT